MIVYIAEKPDIATAIASFLWSDHASCRGKYSYKKGDAIVTWAYGHILMPALPEAYGREYADFSQYPIIPSIWKKVPLPSAKEQLNYICSILKKADVVVNSGDPDREGQLLIDEILEYAGYKSDVQRILIHAKDTDSMKRAFNNIVPNKNFRFLYYAGMAREQADWLVGINLSRAYTMNARIGSYGNVWRIGRVKIPTLALVVNREKEIKDFHSIKYYELKGNFSKEGIPFTATLKPADNVPMDSERHITDRNYVETIRNEVTNKPAKVISSDKKRKLENAPLPYSLDTLQIEINKRYDMSPTNVLVIAQSLYEKKYVSYPRSDCNYIPTSQQNDGKRILKALCLYGLDAALHSDASLHGRCFDDSKVSAHHAIIPTGVVPTGIDEWERKIYDLIALRYIAQFYPVCQYDSVFYEIDVRGHVFSGSGKVLVSAGWRKVMQPDDEDKEIKILPYLAVGDVFALSAYTIETKSTTPPRRFTEGSLLAAMTNIWRFVSPDNPNKDKLKECKGIGTPATRGSIISDLLETKSGKSHILPCIQKSGKELVPTSFGTMMIENMHESLVRPDLTALMEYNLTAISEGKMQLEEFMKEMKNLVRKNIRFVENHASQLRSFNNSVIQDQVVSCMECPICHHITLTRRYSAKTKKHFWVCQEETCVHPATGKRHYYADQHQKPIVIHCPQCELPLSNVYSKKTKKSYWFCSKCDEFKSLK